MFNKRYEERLITWAGFRDSLEDAEEPFRQVQELYNTCPLVSMYTDPYDISTWPDPWQLVEENQYCEFRIVLAQCYSLQLTERFTDAKFEIHIYVDQDKSDMKYLLIINDEHVLGYDRYEVVSKSSLPETLQPQMSHLMHTIQ
mgnify:FL=1|jgi:hypothetical protein|tara:strand:+ start:4310 stop:4738 length:429 start_codon:yes stop_codon:yes gene_type:complete